MLCVISLADSGRVHHSCYSVTHTVADDPMNKGPAQPQLTEVRPSLSINPCILPGFTGAPFSHVTMQAVCLDWHVTKPWVEVRDTYAKECRGRATSQRGRRRHQAIDRPAAAAAAVGAAARLNLSDGRRHRPFEAAGLAMPLRDEAQRRRGRTREPSILSAKMMRMIRGVLVSRKLSRTGNGILSIRSTITGRGRQMWLLGNPSQRTSARDRICRPRLSFSMLQAFQLAYITSIGCNVPDDIGAVAPNGPQSRLSKPGELTPDHTTLLASDFLHLVPNPSVSLF
jgi:hypothetical protein